MNATALRAPPALAPLRQRWQALPPREKTMAAVAGGLLLAALVWWLLVQPALTTLRTAPAQHRALDAQLQQMRALQAEAQAMKSLPRQNPEDARRALEASVKALGTGARLAFSGDQATLTLAGVPADALASWLNQARVEARVQPGQARLVRNAAGTWDGTLMLTLPAR